MKHFPSLTNKRDFSNVFTLGKKKRGTFFSIFVLENNLPFNRLGLCVGKRHGNSVQRHNFSRIIRESFRLYDSDSGMDIVVVLTSKLSFISNDDIRKDFSNIMRLFNLHS